MIKWSFFQNSPVYQHTHTYKHSTLNNIRLKLVYLTRNNLKLFFVLMLLLLFLSFTNNCGKLSFLFVCLFICLCVCVHFQMLHYYSSRSMRKHLFLYVLCFLVFIFIVYYVTFVYMFCLLFCFLLCFVYFFVELSVVVIIFRLRVRVSELMWVKVIHVFLVAKKKSFLFWVLFITIQRNEYIFLRD